MPMSGKCAGRSYNPMAYALTMYYVRALDTLGLLDLLEEDGAYGACTFTIDGKMVSRDLLDSIMEIYFLDRQLGSQRSLIFASSILGLGTGAWRTG